MANDVQAAIDAALTQNWAEAVAINRELLKTNKEDIDTLTRLAYAYCQIDETEKAKKIYKKILTIDRYNSLALKNLNKINSLPAKKLNLIHDRVSPGLFIEEPGKTKVIVLINLAPSKVISQLNIGDLVSLFPKKHSIEIRDANKTYIGALPDDIAFRLLKFISAGNTYLTCIKNIQKNIISLFIREMTRGKKLRHQATFLPTSFKEYTASIQREIKRSVITEEDSVTDANQDESEE
ncbi:hypothetical protein A3D05_04250 [Candidatus Gottesmanbacteria bacterium RIFCSPHIGHO2_02_FULL_40_24]|uniref:Uncharacterized protein n=1 Tax=Candidatus Gottesmanbacteria bacterium RIFCSPHIGHO2_01_FULL_40_15 TaxID=1798376 RepID=A0A1F5Z1U0_9BACT|nr:MAG: hypothetical protein A2777_01040 [Candidatus Gottesmanbacteria bacterium RIFCSPHIGHO2_01_FULL_40_15]OGG17514.1 MAG: hypothetical protein A3D05_04250 [Candidatus Gottesmanbacteria bacterium RIFCSPHIGHO2_02_FULL_40_24]OGG23286.1 MAG: hypothetical protein A3B48_02650 [Candidatus Gottesmanbacteria bacterium RIFCSPLOWO2_01_FULL_40_10]OGG25157.1 MAG: hypothetical protein A3E42_01165 [Candidatus Gottesmanbacteria bacterium RIFCSPHIGHO2_12_FULL_40_13]OGG32724.1 MAG: hypothetical protein A3I80_0